MYELSEVEECQNLFSDLHKDAYGFRPRFGTNEQWSSIEWLKSQIQEVSNDLDRIIDEERKAEQQAIIDFEIRLTDIINLGAGDRETALRWVIGDEKDLEYVCFQNGLPFGYLN